MITFIKIFLTVFWICDILNMPFMEMFDTTYPLNTLFWILVFIFCGGIKYGKTIKSRNVHYCK